MRIRTFPVETFKTMVYCDECNEELVYNNLCYTTIPAKFEHECKKCSKIYMLDNLYPMEFSIEK